MGILGDNTNSGANFEINPIFKWNAVQGRAYTVTRTQGASGWESSDDMVTIPVKFVADFANLQIGWMAFIANRPDFRMVRLADMVNKTAVKPERPSPEHRDSFMVRIYNKSMGMREWRSQSKCVLAVMDLLYEEYLAAPEAAAGQLPVIEISDVKPLKREGPYPGTDMQPVMSITQWVARPELLVPPTLPTAEAPAANGHDNKVVPIQTAARSGHVPPPPPPTSSSAGDDAEF